MVGIISERDIVYKIVAQGKPYEQSKAHEIMTRNVVSINLEDGFDAIYEQIKKISFRHLPVKKAGKVVGIISLRDLRYLKNLKAQEE